MNKSKDFLSNKTQLTKCHIPNITNILKDPFNFQKFKNSSKKFNYDTNDDKQYSNFDNKSYYKRSTFIIEEELIFKKKIISVFEENINENNPDVSNKTNMSNSRKESRVYAKSKVKKPKSCFSACFCRDNNSPESVNGNKRVCYANETTTLMESSKADSIHNSDMTIYRELFVENTESSRHTLTRGNKNQRLSDDTYKNLESEMQMLKTKDYQHKDYRSKRIDEHSTPDFQIKRQRNRSHCLKASYRKVRWSYNRSIVKSHSVSLSTSTPKCSQIKSITFNDADKPFVVEVDKKPTTQTLDAKAANEEEELFLDRLSKTFIDNRYKYNRYLGEGTFGKVWACRDALKNDSVALKINKATSKYHKLAMHEIKLLSRVKKNDITGSNHVIIYKTYIEVEKHVIIIFPEYGDNLYKYLKSIDYAGMRICDVRHISYQMWKAIEFLHNLTIIHTDIKPENVLFITREYKYESDYSPYQHAQRTSIHKVRVPVKTDIVLIDLGNGICEDDAQPKLIVTRYYRPPEVYLELGWDQTVDVWSLGCVIFELYMGRSLFQCRGDVEHMWMMEFILKQFPYKLVKKSHLFKTYFDDQCRIQKNNIDVSKLMKRLQIYTSMYQRKSPEDESIQNIIMSCLKFFTKERIKIRDVLKLPFYSVYENA